MADKHPLQALIEEAGHRTQGYSGRAMYGKQCLAVEADRHQRFGDVLADIVEAIANRVGDFDADDNQAALDELAKVADGFRSMRSDSMGLGSVHYFEDVPFVADEEDEDEEEGGDDA